MTEYKYDGSDQLESITYADGKKVSYKYDKNDNLTEVTDRTGAVTTYVYDAINRITEIHRPNGVSTYNSYNARDQIVTLKNICDDCEWVISQYDYTYDDRGFITNEDATESLYGYAFDDKHNGKHENWHDDLYPHGDKHNNKHDKDGLYGFQIIGTKRDFTYDADGKLLTATENEDRQGKTAYTFTYDDMGNRTSFEKIVRGAKAEAAEYTYNDSNQLVSAREYDGKHWKNVEYTNDADGNRTMREEVKPDGTRKVEMTYEYAVENRLKAVHDKNDLLAAMAYDGDGNRIFQLNYNLHTDDDWKGNSGNGNGNNKDNAGSGNSGKNSGNGTGSKVIAGMAAITSDTTVTDTAPANAEAAGAATDVPETAADEKPGAWNSIVSFFTGKDKKKNKNAKDATAETTANTNTVQTYSSNKDKDKGNNGNDKNNGKGNGNGNSGNNGNTSTGGSNDNNGNAGGNTNNTGGSQNQSGILFPIDGQVSELEQELIDQIKTTGKQKNYELVEYVNDVNRDYAEVLMELNINGIMDTAYSYGDQRLTNERFTGWTGYYTYDARGSVSGVTDDKGMIWQSYRYSISGEITFGKPQYNNVYSYNAENYNPNIDSQYLRARYYSVGTANSLTEDGYLGQISVPLSLNRYNYVKSSPLNFIDPSGFESYVFYTSTKKSDFSKQAQWRAEQLEKKGETVILKETNSANDFIDAWNSMGEVDGKEVLIEDVIIYSHGRPYTLIFADGSSTEAISIDGKNSTGKSIPNIHDLMEKAVTRLYINACNAGHLTYYEDMGGNVASAFSEKIGENGVVYAYDGNVSFGPHAWEVGAETSYETRLSSPWAQKTYWESTKEHSLTNPQPKGETMYHNGKIQNYYPSTSITAVRK